MQRTSRWDGTVGGEGGGGNKNSVVAPVPWVTLNPWQKRQMWDNKMFALFKSALCHLFFLLTLNNTLMSIICKHNCRIDPPLRCFFFSSQCHTSHCSIDVLESKGWLAKIIVFWKERVKDNAAALAYSGPDYNDRCLLSKANVIFRVIHSGAGMCVQSCTVTSALVVVQHQNNKLKKKPKPLTMEIDYIFKQQTQHTLRQHGCFVWSSRFQRGGRGVLPSQTLWQ